MITIAAHGAPNADNQGPAVQVSMRCELSQETCSSVFTAALIRAEQRFWDEDPEPDLIETIVCEIELDCLLPAVFQAVDQWLYAGHRLCVTPTSWRSGITGPSTGFAVLFEGEAGPAAVATSRIRRPADRLRSA
ncbi:hypothetical protein A5658_22065 [Mycobacterium sp. 1245111.1]|uniref:hypothetical protein n=1 Tax=Mycobacterium sp. 1245111.1 TaxID=1834073 RepID=UPI0007FF158F|nr:hypothetical protein [Mycobacterium sp. 1245111.1]OBK40321.1 hypothetical protein A5658_22065 [Mycobacterium sp. 1245111.1]